MRVLILGGSGLISNQICANLRDSGHCVTVFHRGNQPPIDGVESIRGVRSSAHDLTTARDSNDYEAVIDMICFDSEQATLAVDVFGGTVTQWIHCSTVDVYRKDSGLYPLTETAERGARSSFPYAVGKVAAEIRLEGAAKKGAFALTIVRPAATYLDSAVAPFGSFRLLVERIRNGRPIILPGDGSSIWSAVHRDDLAPVFANAVGNPQAYNRAYHVAGEQLMTWREYWRTIGRALGIAPKFVYVPTNVLGTLAGADASWCVENYQYDSIFDCTAASNDLDYRYRTTWEEGVSRFNLSVTAIDYAEQTRYEHVLRTWESGEGRVV